MIAALLLGSLIIQPWNGKDLPTTSHAAVKYRLVVTGKPSARVRLDATRVAGGWIAAFCTSEVCAPGHVTIELPQSGQAVYQFELIREADDAPRKSGAHIVGDDGSSIDVPTATR